MCYTVTSFLCLDCWASAHTVLFAVILLLCCNRELFNSEYICSSSTHATPARMPTNWLHTQRTTATIWYNYVPSAVFFFLSPFRMPPRCVWRQSVEYCVAHFIQSVMLGSDWIKTARPYTPYKQCPIPPLFVVSISFIAHNGRKYFYCYCFFCCWSWQNIPLFALIKINEFMLFDMVEIPLDHHTHYLILQFFFLSIFHAFKM